MSSRAAYKLLAVARRTSPAPPRYLTSRTISSTSRLLLKESSGATPDYTKHKEDSLSKQKQGKGHWKPELASNSEEAIKADRSHTPESMDALQERTKHAARDSAHHGTSMHDGL